MKYSFSIVAFNLLICLSSNFDYDYRAYSHKLFKDNICGYNNRDYVRNDHSKRLAHSDTANIIINLPIYSLINPEAHEEGQYDYTKLNSLIDYYEDYESQYAIIKKGAGYTVMISTIGLSKRWSEYTKGRSLAGNLIDAKIIPSDKIDWRENYNFGYKYFSIDRFHRYTQLNPDLEIFTIYNMDGLFYTINDRLIRLDFTNKGINELDGQEFYQNNIINKGFDKIKDIIIGGNPFWIK